jgi:hypothetical protein
MSEGKNVPAQMPAGGKVIAIIPQSVEETFRLARGVVEADLAPYALIKGKTPDKAATAVAVVIMAGAELGLPPMASLRLMTAINNRPALYGDGTIAVIRMRRVAKTLKMGFTPGKSAEFGDDACGWCEAERADTGETARHEFTVGDAKRAGLWDERDKVERKGVMSDNDAPWHRYPKRMLMWRAAGYNLRELFADVLTGIPDEYEAREAAIAEGSLIEMEEGRYVAASSMPPAPPKSPAEPEPEEEAVDVLTSEDEKQALIDQIDTSLSAATTEDDLERRFSDLHVQERLSGDDERLAEAFDIKNHHLERVRPGEGDE